MKTSMKVIIGIFLIVIVGLVGFQMTGRTADEGPGIYDEFAQCVTDSGAKMYGAYWCPHCTSQKETFGKSFDYIDYVECDPRGNNANPDACDAAGITGYPTWIFGNGERASGSIPLSEIARRSGCKLN